MIRSWLSRLAFLLVFLFVGMFPTLATAQSKGAVHVVNLDSDDATEDHADALTAALKSRVRATPGWQMSEANDSLSMLIPALKCSARPDSTCLQKIGDQLKTDRFFWGSVTKGPAAHQVTADVHLWLRAKPEQSVKESYSDNLKDQNDEALRVVASRIFEHLTGATTEGTVSVHSSVTNAQVWVDGQQKGLLTSGTTTLTLAAGTHNVELRADGYAPTGQSISIITGSESSVTIEPVKSHVPLLPPGETRPNNSHVMRYLGFTGLGVGFALGVVGAIEAVRFLNLQSDNTEDHANPALQGVSDFCNPGPVSDPNLAKQACDRKKSAESARTAEYVLLSSGAAVFVAGAILLAIDHGSSTPKKPTAWRVLPTVGGGGGGVSLSGAF